MVAGMTTPPQPVLATDDTVTTELQPGLNLAGWTEATTGVEAIFDQLPEVEVVYAWSAPGQRFRWAARTDSGVLGNLHVLKPGMGLLLVVSGERTVTWTRPVVEAAGFLFVYEGWNLVAWTGEDGAPTRAALQDLTLTSVVDGTGAEPASLIRGGAFWFNASARRWWGQPTTPASAEQLEAIQELPWVRDGLEDSERPHVDMLREIGERSSEALSAIMSGGWIEEDLPNHRALILADLDLMATFHHSAVALIASLPFLDSLEHEDVRVVDALYWLVVADRFRASDFLSVLGSHDNAASLSSIDVWLAYLDFKDRSAADGLRKLDWFQDGIPAFVGERVGSYRISENLEYWTVRDLVSIYYHSPRVYLALVQKEWMNGPRDGYRYNAVDRINNISRPDAQLAYDILEMPFLDTFELADLAALEFLQELKWYDRAGLRELVSHYSEGGITQQDVPVLRGQYLKFTDPDAAAVLLGLPWLGDGIAVAERGPATLIQRLALEAEPVFRVLAGKGWLDDGVNQDEEGVLEWLVGLAGRTQQQDVEIAVRISQMPFLSVIDGADAAAMGSLVGMHWSGGGSALESILGHPALEGGVTDEQAPLVAVLHDVGRGGGADFDTNAALAILEAGAFSVGERSVPIPGLGEVRLAVISREGTARGTLDLLEEAVVDQVTFMRTPFPRSFVGLAVVDRVGAGGGPGGIITIPAGHENSLHLITHEVAHTYWPFYPPWLAEGPAEFMANRLAGIQLLGACTIADTLGELDRLARENIDRGMPDDDVYRGSGCAYTLGSSLFVALYQAVGDKAFRQGFSRLYLALRDDVHAIECSGVEKGVCYVKQAFVANTSPEVAALAEPVINRLYYGNPDGPGSDPR